MSDTLAQLVGRCVLRLGMVTGKGVQVYAEDILGELIQEQFTKLFDEYWWEDYMVNLVTPLTTLGVTATDMKSGEGLDRFTDIQHVWYKNYNKPLGRLSARTNTAPMLTQDSHPHGILPINSNKIFQLLPYGTSGDNVTVTFRKRPDAFKADDVILMDDLALIFGAVYSYLEDDGTNPGATEKTLNSFNVRLQQLKTMRNEQDIPLFYDGTGGVLTNWTEIR